LIMRWPTQRSRVACVSVAVAAALGAGSPAARQHRATPARGPEDYRARVEAFRAKHEQDYRRDFVTIAGLHFLDPGVHRLGSDPAAEIVLAGSVPSTVGRLSVDGGRVAFEPAPGVVIMQDSRSVKGTTVLKEPGKPPAPELSIGRVRVVVHESGDRLSLRVRDPAGEPARGFKGFRWFPIDASYRVTARLIRDAAPRTLQVVNTLNDVVSYNSEGVVEFELHGRKLRLRPFTTRPGRLYFVFRDASSGEETYATGRFLYTDLAEDGTTVLDFNEAYNPPCAFNPHTTCPIPMKENILPVKILAGERAYAGEVKLPHK
jgi:uncharacterized protein (DUF1684 family)